MRTPFTAALALSLLIGAGASPVMGAPVAAPPQPAAPGVGEDWDDLSEIAAPVKPNAAPAAPAVVSSAVVEQALLVSRFGQSLAATRNAKTSAQRIVAYRDTLELFDRIRVRQPEFSFKPGVDLLSSSYVDALNAERASLRGEAHERNLGEARAVVLRLSDVRARAGKMLDIAQVERDSGSPEQLLVALHGVVGEVLRLDVADRDPALLRAVGIAAGGGPESRAASELWLTDIEDHALRGKALRKLAEASIAADPLLAELTMNAKLGDDRRSRLLDLSNYMTNEGRFDQATWLAAAADPDTRGERDEALALVVEDMIKADSAPSDILAVHGIGGAALRDRTLLSLVEHDLEVGQLHEARRVERLMTGSTSATLASSVIGLWLADRDYREQARDAGKTALAAYRKSPIPAGAARDAVLGKLLELQIRLGDRAQAGNLLGQVGATTAATLRVSMVRGALDARQWDEADGYLARIPVGPLRDEALARYVNTLASDRRTAEALEMLPRIAGPLPQLDAITATIKALAASSLEPQTQRDLARKVDALAAKVAVGAGRDTAQAYVAQTAAALGEFDRARRSLLLATTSSAYSDALRYTAQRMTAAGQADVAVRDLEKVWQPAERLRGLASVATALAKQGEVERAVGIVRAMDDDRLRVEAFVRVAQAAAQKADRHELFKPAGAEPSVAPALLRKVKEDSDTPAPYLSSRARSLYKLTNDNLGDTMPSIPALEGQTAKAVAASVPAIAPGRLHVLPLQYSDFNEKFLASLSYAFNDYGGRLFYFDAQKTAFPVFISLDSGVFDLPSIANYLERIGKSQYLVREGRRYTLRIPLLVGVNATLVVSGTDVEELRMNRSSGAYLVNAGRLSVQGTTVSGWDETINARAPLTYAASGNFRPFIVGWSGSVTDIAGSTLTHLGFSGAKAYGLTYSSGPEILLKSQATGLKRPTGRVVENSFQHMLYGFYSYEADDVAVVGNEYRDNIVYGVDPHDRSRRLLIAYNTAYGTAVKHGIIISREVDDGWIAGNLSFDNKGSGIMLDRNSKGNLVYANSSFANQQDGVTLFESPCNIVAGNQLFANHRDGLKSRNSWDVGVFGNVMSGNRGMAVTSYVATLKSEHAGHERDFEEDPYTQFSDIALVQNTLTRNGAGGVGLQGVASVTWKGNSLVGQAKPVKGVAKATLPELYGRSDRGVVVRMACEAPKTVQACDFKKQGLLPEQVVYEPLAVCAPSAAPPSPPTAGVPTGTPGGLPLTRASASRP